MATNYLYANPGQLIKIAVQTLDGYGDRSDGYAPVISSVVMPDSTIASGYPAAMVKVSTGLYSYSLQLPTGYTALGSYIISVYSQTINKTPVVPIWDVYVINVARPFGASAASPFGASAASPF